MKKRNRFAALTIVAAMAATIFAGCGSSDTSSSSGTATGTSSSGTDKDYEITMIMSIRDEFLSTLETGAQENCPDGVTLTTQDAQNDAAKQQQMIESARNAENDAIIINLVDPAAAESMVDAAGGIPVVLVNRYPTDDSILEAGKVVYVGSDEEESGRLQGEYLVDYFNAKGQTDITYVMLQGTLGLPSTSARSASAVQALKDGGLNVTLKGSELAGEWDRGTAIEVFSSLVSVGGVDFDCVISNNDAMALGVVEAMEQKGMDPSSIPIVGIDATADGRQAIKDGKMAMSAFQDPIGQGKGAILAAINLIEGNDISEGTDYETDETGTALWVPFEAVTIDNVAEYDNR
ncbi:MAG: substrate-binding domain-containing protein [Lachnospiraceae bacterium]|nr:substrate-binding domain-containing protein [Lachnospiraceae bacterium]